MSVLGRDQIDFFKRHGYLVLENLVEPEIVAGWQRDLADYYQADLARPELWSFETVRKRPGRFSIEENRALRNLPRMRTVIDQLGGGRFQGGEDNLITRWPEPGEEWRMPQKGHIDLILTAFSWRFTVGATTYLFDVEPQGGALCIWPGSHHAVWRYFRAHPEQYDTGSDNQGRHRMERDLNAYAQNGIQPIQCTARAGTVILWHAFLLHEASPNRWRLPRAGLFLRWGEEVPEGQPIETFGDLWEHWAI